MRVSLLMLGGRAEKELGVLGNGRGSSSGNLRHHPSKTGVKGLQRRQCGSEGRGTWGLARKGPCFLTRKPRSKW